MKWHEGTSFSVCRIFFEIKKLFYKAFKFCFFVNSACNESLVETRQVVNKSYKNAKNIFIGLISMRKFKKYTKKIPPYYIRWKNTKQNEEIEKRQHLKDNVYAFLCNLYKKRLS